MEISYSLPQSHQREEGNSMISWGPRLSKLFQAGPRGGKRGSRVQDALPSLVH